jgi:hypothetical protein
MDNVTFMSTVYVRMYSVSIESIQKRLIDGGSGIISTVRPSCTLPARFRSSSLEVEKCLTEKTIEASELIYFKMYKSQLPIIEQA